MKKLSIFLLSALLVLSCVAQNNDDTDYDQLSDDEIQNDPIVNDVLQYGLNYVFAKAAEKYGVSNDTLEITEVNSVYRQELETQTNFRCDIDATNNDDATLRATFTIEYDNESEEKEVRRWRYTINYSTDEEGENNEENDLEAGADEETYWEEEQIIEWNSDSDYEDVSDDEIANSEVIQDVLETGLNYVFAQAAEKYGVSNDTLEITDVNSVERQELEDVTNYRCDIDATNNDDATIHATFTIEYENETGEQTVRRWWYHIEYQTDDNADASNELQAEDEGSLEV